jgi:hypothetical protein
MYCAIGTLYKYAHLEGTKISKVWGSYHNFHLAHPILIRPMALQRRHIIELQKEIFRPRRDEFFGDTTKERSSRRTTLKSRFKGDTWPTCHQKMKLLHQISL